MYSRKNKGANNSPHCQFLEQNIKNLDNTCKSQDSPSFPKFLSSESIYESSFNLNIPIALRKGVRTSTQYNISIFVFYNRLNPSFKVFTADLSSVSILNSIQEALKDKKWKEIVQEEIRALYKNGTWELVEHPSGKKVIGCK